MLKAVRDFHSNRAIELDWEWVFCSRLDDMEVSSSQEGGTEKYKYDFNRFSFMAVRCSSESSRCLFKFFCKSVFPHSQVIILSTV